MINPAWPEIAKATPANLHHHMGHDRIGVGAGPSHFTIHPLELAQQTVFGRGLERRLSEPLSCANLGLKIEVTDSVRVGFHSDADPHSLLRFSMATIVENANVNVQMIVDFKLATFRQPSSEGP